MRSPAGTDARGSTLTPALSLARERGRPAGTGARGATLVLALTVLIAAPAFANPIVIDGEVPDDGHEFLLIPFEVPPGTKEVEVAHDDLSATNILDFGVQDPERLRGWGGGNTENAIIGEQAASRSYLTGPLPAGTWQVIIGKAKIVDPPGRYHLEITLRTTPTLAPQTERRPYQPVPALEPTARWYAGDFHVHSRESGDAVPTIDAIADFARSRGLDFVELSEHNTVSQLDFIDDAQPRHPHLLLLPGVEFTTYHGHANGIGATKYVDFRLGENGWDIEQAAKAFEDQGAVFSINHPALDLGNVCIGCAWKQPLPAGHVHGVEIETGGYDKSGILFAEQSIALWDAYCAKGLHVAAMGGSDDHRGGQGTGQFDSPIGNPTVMVFANELSAAGIVAGVKAGRTVVKMQGPADPMVELTAGEAMVGDTVHAASVTLKAHVTGGQGDELRLVHDGKRLDPVAITADPFDYSLPVDAPGSGESRWRAEIWVDGHPRTVTSHLWIAPPPPEPVAQGCGCGATGGGFSLFLLALLALRRR